jgi:hypothetical protein
MRSLALVDRDALESTGSRARRTTLALWFALDFRLS